MRRYRGAPPYVIRHDIVEGAEIADRGQQPNYMRQIRGNLRKPEHPYCTVKVCTVSRHMKSCSGTVGLVLLLWYSWPGTVALVQLAWYCCPGTVGLVLLAWYCWPGTVGLVLLPWYCWPGTVVRRAPFYVACKEWER